MIFLDMSNSECQAHAVRQSSRRSSGVTSIDNVQPTVKEWQEDLQDGTLAFQSLDDAEIYEAELKHIFARSWLALGHESEIPNSGDFMVRTMGADEVIVSRDDE